MSRNRLKYTKKCLTYIVTTSSSVPLQYHVIVHGVTINHSKFIMKLQVKQLDERVCKLIASALEMSSIIWEDLHPNLSTEAKQLSTEFKHCIFLQVSEAYESPEDDVQVLGRR